MRHDPRYSRVRTMITDPVIPRNGNGVLRLCHHCQRRVYFAKGFLRLLQATLYAQGKYPVIYGRA